MAAESYKESLAFQRALRAAGFKAGKISYVGTDDGAAWETTLTWRGKKVVRAHNGGHGGPTQVGPHLPDGWKLEDMTAAKALMNQALEAFFAVPEVQAAERAFEMDVFDYSKPSEEERAAKLAEVAAKVYPVDEERAGDLIADFADGAKEIAAMKRKASKVLCWAEKGHKFGNYTSIKAPDTPKNREQVQKLHAARFEGFQGFVADLLADF